MQSLQLEQMIKGWFIGNFSPSILHTELCEVAVKHYKAGESEDCHLHKIATEVTVVVTGAIFMCGREWGPGSIVRLEPGEQTSFLALCDSITVVVKLPSVVDDKYIIRTPGSE